MATIEITHATVVKGPGMDNCVLHTSLPAAAYPFKGHEAMLLFAARDTGEDYIRENFPGIPIKVVERV